MEKFEIYQFKIDAFTLETLPMARLAAYLVQLASLFGNSERVHFDKLKRGSAIFLTKVETQAVPKVEARLHQATGLDAPEDVAKIYRTVNKMLRDDNASGVLKKSKGATIIKFPGKKAPIAETIRVVETGSLEGILIRVGGTDETLPVWLQDVDGVIYYCNTRDRQIARQLAAYYLGPPVRVHGSGKWLRNQDEKWELEEFTVANFEPLVEQTLAQTVEDIRAIPGNEWDEVDDPIAYLKRIRGNE